MNIMLVRLESISQDRSISQELEQLKKLIGDDHSEGALNAIGHLVKAATISGIGSFKQIITYTSLQTYKIVNNALAKEGVKGFMSIGGKAFLQEGAKAVITQSGQALAQGAVTEVTKNTVTIGQQVVKTGFQLGSFLKGLGIGIAINVAVGGLKSYINTKWLDEFVFICECDKEFNFELIENFEKFNQKCMNDMKNLENLQNEINNSCQIDESKRYLTNNNIKTPQDQEYKQQQQQQNESQRYLSNRHIKTPQDQEYKQQQQQQQQNESQRYLSNRHIKTPQDQEYKQQQQQQQNESQRYLSNFHIKTPQN
ncbi:hypothetical protein TTHERM_00816270 (macronuclear) [Tetrahymena thermophila SB210]|uniref:Uncharacterized protein n=1 Tax=Tetrahymena thermophila (strain SB210) TaxID=312017 RepID=Q23HB9_TETTS|nr:hypothetical protein TTHERM_00816270 [Tetrahymena thermophila SB210]EAR95889.3 hypothetical protein TTHERM_00816270 [Tetrahymena thermophila SB210]|eukprot:XP_001016134.3 hypothetical protein TTHERM_00816270 [Tetrahymena thermophila SB210]